MAEKRTAVVTGGAGFIGSHLCERLLADGQRVICIDNFITSDVANIESMLKNSDFEFIKLDISEPFDLESYPELARFKLNVHGVQEVYHLACPTSAKKFDNLRIQTYLANSVGMRNVLDMAVKYKARLLHASTAVVYGPRHLDGSKFKETDLGVTNHISPRACYDEGKRFAETACFTYASVFGLDVRVARIFRTYGPRQRLNDGEMMPDFVLDALEGRDLIMYGEEDFSTALLFVTDLVDGLIRLMQISKNPGPVNFGGDEDLKLADVARKVIAMTGSSSQVKYEAPLLFMTPLGLPDTRRAVDELGWIPLVRLDDGLKRTIEYTLVTKGLAKNL
ncbi:MAG: NAD-dependent epimerase/dehydratase family protein [Patescibacteria group bacterium]|jgi:UDP-glucuronate decarboxylase